ncbi:hypothetical protein K1719_030996 [Acacia pycnantha]|nr:hypothetical protein K1719_030996 [Acacia pycnantha]
MSEAGIVDAFLFIGPEPKDVMRQYITVTGAPAMPQLFSTAYHQCRWNYQDEEDVENVDSTFDDQDIPCDVLWLDIDHMDGKNLHYGGVEHHELHNVYGYYFHMAKADGLVKRGESKDRPFVLSRAFSAGTQRYGAVWTGDKSADWDQLRVSVPVILSLGLTGLPFSDNRIRKLEANLTGTPVLRPFWMEFPSDEATFSNDEAFMVGNSLLVQGIYTERAKHVSVYLPGRQPCSTQMINDPYSLVIALNSSQAAEGYSSRAKNALIEPSNEKVEIENAPLSIQMSQGPFAMTIRRPNVGVADNWTIKVL